MVVVVIGTAKSRAETVDELLALSVEHVRRSRAEPGCIEHAVHRDVEDPLRLVFVERWSNRAALLAHFAVPASGAFVHAATALCAEPPSIRVFEAEEVSLR